MGSVVPRKQVAVILSPIVGDVADVGDNLLSVFHKIIIKKKGSHDNDELQEFPVSK